MRIALQVEEIALDFGQRFSGNQPEDPIDCPLELREMVIAAVIGSGVRYDLARTLAKAVLENPSRERIHFVSSKHRFPNQSRKRLLTVFAEDASLLKSTIALLRKPKCVFTNRKLISKFVPGLGPKQTSFLFNCSGHGQKIAVLDRHILKYLQLVGVIERDCAPTTWTKYENIEAKFLAYAEEKNLRADALDLAIWITMKAASGRISKCVQ